MNYYLITDTHFGHDKLMEYCGRPKGFEEKIIINLRLLPQDSVLIHLGDFCIGGDEYWHEKFMGAFKGKKWLVMGNHDHKSASWYISHGWDFAGFEIKLKMFGKHILLSHIPVKNDDWYDINIHGHFHNSDHRMYEPELVQIANPKHKLFAIEYTNYHPVKLETMI